MWYLIIFGLENNIILNYIHVAPLSPPPSPSNKVKNEYLHRRSHTVLLLILSFIKISKIRTIRTPLDVIG